MGEYYKRAKKEVILPSDSASHYDFTEGFRTAEGQMLELIVEADEEIKELQNNLENTRQLLENLMMEVRETE